MTLIKALTLTYQQLLQHISKNKPSKPIFGLPEAQLLLQAVQKRWAQYITSIEQDIELLEKPPPSEYSEHLEQLIRRQKMAIQIRLGEKDILQRLSTMLTNYITNFESGKTAAKRNAPDNSGSWVRKAKPRT
jgi:N-lysine methyltransferase SETD6